MKKWLDKYDIPQAENGIEGTMGGLTDQGFNYNGAWGGQFQDGGSMLDSVKTKKLPLKEISKIPNKPQRTDSNLENVIEIFDPTGITSWDDVYRSYQETGWSPQTGIEVFGALPFLGKVGKVGKVAEAASRAFAITGRQKRNAKAVAETLKAVGNYGPAVGRVTDAYQAYDQWQNGGSMPGAVGFMYARTQGAAPANGPYAKKTKASAENGMTFYQEGLDWKPRNISENGTELPTFQGGGKTPIYTDNPKDPRLKAYNDSLRLYRNEKNIYEKETGLSYDKLLRYKRPNIPDGPTYGWTLNNHPLYGYKKPVQPVIYRKPEPVKPISPIQIIEKVIQQSQKIEQPVLKEYSGNPVYTNTPYSRGAGALIGFENKGDTTYIAPEDYERFAVPSYGKNIIESKKKKQRNGGVNQLDAQPIKKLDQLLNFTNYNKPTKGGWLSKYED